MKIRLFAVLMIALLVLPLLAGCQAVRVQAETVPAPAQTVPAEAPKADAAPEAAPAAPVAEAAPSAASPAITAQEAEAIALEHAGLTTDQVSYLRIELDHDDGCQEYEIEFRVDRWEYDYEIQADTGAILSWDRDWDD